MVLSKLRRVKGKCNMNDMKKIVMKCLVLSKNKTNSTIPSTAQVLTKSQPLQQYFRSIVSIDPDQKCDLNDQLLLNFPTEWRSTEDKLTPNFHMLL